MFALPNRWFCNRVVGLPLKFISPTHPPNHPNVQNSKTIIFNAVESLENNSSLSVCAPSRGPFVDVYVLALDPLTHSPTPKPPKLLSPPYCGSLFFFAYSHLPSFLLPPPSSHLPPFSLLHFSLLQFSLLQFTSLHFSSVYFTFTLLHFNSLHFHFIAGSKRGGALYLPGCVLLGRQCSFSP